MTRSKFDKKKCLTCMYRGVGSLGSPVKVKNKTARVYCNYAGITDCTCLRPSYKGTTIDLRGTDYKNCKLYQRGEMIVESTEQNQITYGRKLYDSKRPDNQ